MSGDVTRKNILKITVVIFVSLIATAQLRAVAPIDPFSSALSATGVLSDVQGTVGDGIEILDASQDLLDEVESPSDGVDEISRNTITFNRKLNELKGDMREIGYAPDEIKDFTERFNSSKTSIAQKMRSLRRALHSMKRVRNIFSKDGGKDSMLYQKATLATEQQVMHLQLQQIQRQELKELEERRREMEERKNLINEINKTAESLAKKKEGEVNYKSVVSNYTPEKLQAWAFSGALMSIMVAALLIMILPFQEEGKLLLKAGVLGIIFIYLIPMIINLYRSWLGI